MGGGWSELTQLNQLKSELAKYENRLEELRQGIEKFQSQLKYFTDTIGTINYKSSGGLGTYVWVKSPFLYFSPRDTPRWMLTKNEKWRGRPNRFANRTYLYSNGWQRFTDSYKSYYNSIMLLEWYGKLVFGMGFSGDDEADTDGIHNCMKTYNPNNEVFLSNLTNKQIQSGSGELLTYLQELEKSTNCECPSYYENLIDLVKSKITWLQKNMKK